MKKLPILLLIFGTLLVFSFIGFNNYIYRQKQGNGKPVMPYVGTLSGEYVCLPHRNRSGPQTLECAFGLKTLTGEHYALDFGQKPPSDFMVGVTVTLDGTITPVEYLSSDQWQKYDIIGIFSIK